MPLRKTRQLLPAIDHKYSARCTTRSEARKAAASAGPYGVKSRTTGACWVRRKALSEKTPGASVVSVTRRAVAVAVTVTGIRPSALGVPTTAVTIAFGATSSCPGGNRSCWFEDSRVAEALEANEESDPLRTSALNTHVALVHWASVRIWSQAVQLAPGAYVPLTQTHCTVCAPRAIDRGCVDVQAVLPVESAIRERRREPVKAVFPSLRT
mmetsp:Transcript_32245/g.84368  ORF Transcript_32245/g.84368 Transcript_32245/m.84368 type:complete len:211 (+) Transcript_32245:118-750(+)